MFSNLQLTLVEEMLLFSVLQIRKNSEILHAYPHHKHLETGLGFKDIGVCANAFVIAARPHQFEKVLYCL